jgi:hypothetical protein
MNDARGDVQKSRPQWMCYGAGASLLSLTAATGGSARGLTVQPSRRRRQCNADAAPVFPTEKRKPSAEGLSFSRIPDVELCATLSPAARG